MIDEARMAVNGRRGAELTRNHASGPDDPAALRREIGQLREAIDSRAVIEQAKGMLMLRYDLEADAAFAVLVRWSQTGNIKLHTLAQGLVAHLCQTDAACLADPALVQWLETCLLSPN